MRATLREIAEAADPKKALLDAAGDLSDYEIFHNQVLVATYAGTHKIGSLLLPDSKIAEGRFQGKIGLVLKAGPLAFVDDAATKFGGVTLSRGDWVLYRPSDGLELFIRDRRTVNDGLPCRLFDDTLIKGRVSDPGLIY